MKSKTFFLLVFVFILVLAGAYVLYDRLSSGVEIESLVTQGESVAAMPPAEADPNPPVEATQPPAEENSQLTAAPDFTVVDWDGEEVSLSDFREKPVVLNFWASWCGPCQIEMPHFQEAYDAYGQDIHFLMVNLTDGSRETLDTAKQFLEDSGYTFPVYFDPAYEGAIAYGVMSIPVTYFIDADGNAVAYANTSLSAEVLQMGIDMIYAP